MGGRRVHLKGIPCTRQTLHGRAPWREGHTDKPRGRKAQPRSPCAHRPGPAFSAAAAGAQTSAATLYGEGRAGRGVGDVFTRSRGSRATSSLCCFDDALVGMERSSSLRLTPVRIGPNLLFPGLPGGWRHRPFLPGAKGLHWQPPVWMEASPPWRMGPERVPSSPHPPLLPGLWFATRRVTSWSGAPLQPPDCSFRCPPTALPPPHT